MRRAMLIIGFLMVALYITNIAWFLARGPLPLAAAFGPLALGILFCALHYVDERRRGVWAVALLVLVALPALAFAQAPSDATDFATIETLRTFTGQVAAVSLLTIVAKMVWTSAPTTGLRAFVLVIAVALHALMSWKAGLGPAMIVLMTVNGINVGFAAMKWAEMIKGEKPA